MSSWRHSSFSDAINQLEHTYHTFRLFKKWTVSYTLISLKNPFRIKTFQPSYTYYSYCPPWR
jgi:hypothetical protein